MHTTKSQRNSVAAAIVIVSICSLSHPSRAADSGWVARLNGAPTVTRAGSIASLKVGDSVQVGDVIETDADSKVKILLVDDSVLDIGAQSRVALDALSMEPSRRVARIDVTLGRFKLAVAKFFGGASDYEIRTPTAVAGVRGTVLWGDTVLDAICALDGTIEVRTIQATTSRQLGAGACLQRFATGKPQPLKPSAADLAAYLKAVRVE